MKTAVLLSTSTILSVLALTSSPVLAQTAVFTDNFGNGSTLNGTSTPGGTPAASSTSYDIASSKAATTVPSIAAGDLKVGLNAATTSGFVEAQAVFASTPVSLATIGDYINLTYSFTDTGGGLLAGGTASYIFNGLFNSGGSTPVAGGLNNSGLSATAGSPFATGNAANWQGYVSRISNGGTSQAYTRGLQNGVGTSSANQDLIGNNFGGGAFNNPAGTTFGGSETAAAALTSGSQYTLSYTIALTAAGTLTVTNNLFSGVGIGGAMVFSQTNSVTGANVLTTSFDGLAIGVRNSGTSFNPIMDISQINVSSLIQTVPEPGSLAILAGAGALLLARRSRRC